MQIACTWWGRKSVPSHLCMNTSWPLCDYGRAPVWVIYGTFCSGRKKRPLASGNTGHGVDFPQFTELGIQATQKSQRRGQKNIFKGGTVNHKIKQAPRCTVFATGPRRCIKYDAKACLSLRDAHERSMDTETHQRQTLWWLSPGTKRIRWWCGDF